MRAVRAFNLSQKAKLVSIFVFRVDLQLELWR
jgi:hypothetical protein